MFPSFRFRILLLRLTLPPSSLSGHGLRTSYNGTPRPTIRNRDQDLADILLFFPLVRRTIRNLSEAVKTKTKEGNNGTTIEEAEYGAGTVPKTEDNGINVKKEQDDPVGKDEEEERIVKEEDGDAVTGEDDNMIVMKKEDEEEY